MTSSHTFFAGTAATADQQPQHQVQTSWWNPTNSLTATRILPPMDPPEDKIATDDSCYYDESNIVVSQQQNSMSYKHDVKAIVSSLSLRPPDPPGFNCSSLGKRKYDSRCNYDDEGGDICLTMPSLVTKKSKAAPPLQTLSTLSNASAAASLSSTSSPTATPAPTTQQIVPLNVNSGDVPSSSSNNDDNLIDEIDEAEAVDSEVMSIDDSSSCSSSSNNNNNGREEDHGDDNSSIVSESSIRKVVYQLVFGRLSMNSTIGSGGVGGGGTVGKYDAVDSKIEDLIRRSRLEATIKDRKEKEKKNGGDWCEVRIRSMASMSSSDMDMDMDDDDDNEDADSDVKNTGGGERRHDADGWTPGHG